MKFTLIQTISRSLTGFWDTILSYFTVCIGFISSLDLMDAGAGLLLIVRLLIDVPRVYRAWFGKGDK